LAPAEAASRPGDTGADYNYAGSGADQQPVRGPIGRLADDRAGLGVAAGRLHDLGGLGRRCGRGRDRAGNCEHANAVV
jgi:hypothetical protein